MFEKTGYYFHIDAEKLMFGVGIHTFSKPLLKAYRDAVVDPDFGQQLAGIVSLLGDKGYKMGRRFISECLEAMILNTSIKNYSCSAE